MSPRTATIDYLGQARVHFSRGQLSLHPQRERKLPLARSRSCVKQTIKSFKTRACSSDPPRSPWARLTRWTCEVPPSLVCHRCLLSAAQDNAANMPPLSAAANNRRICKTFFFNVGVIRYISDSMFHKIGVGFEYL